MGDNMRRTNIYLDDDDRRAITVIQSAYGQEHASSAIRFALRETAHQIVGMKRRRATAARPQADGAGEDVGG